MLIMRELLELLVRRGGSDLHITAGAPPKMRVNGALLDTEYEPLTGDDIKSIVYGVLSTEQIARFERELELDISFGLPGIGRFRTNVFVQRGCVGSVLRFVPERVRGFDELGLPREICEELCRLPKGLVLVTGATGSGKSTTLAAMVDHLNSTRPHHIVTIEDPIEFVHKHKKSLVNQREVGPDTHEFKKALRAALRQDPDVVLVGEMRDLDTIEAALSISETGHLTFSTLHTSDAVQTIGRIIDVFPAGQQAQIRTQLASTLSAVFCQQLLPRANGRGRVMACEILLCSPAVRALIREDKGHQVYSIIQTSRKQGMRTMNQSLSDLYRANEISYEEALAHSSDQGELERLLRST
ncbi:MAG: type IV pilus twitching motility protein PilT [Planctomycetes bacterium]|nr:type IV pilus twitching motility protein PilT [Planctomycetota bacterium]